MKDFFPQFLRTRRLARHFRRLMVFETLPREAISREAPPSLAKTLLDAVHCDIGTLVKTLDSHSGGLTFKHADNLRKRVGGNTIEHEAPLSRGYHLWLCYRNPFNLLLTVLALISYMTHDLKATAVIGLMVVQSTLLRFWQESKSNKEADALKAMVVNTATVIRRGAPHQKRGGFEHQESHHVELPITQLVPGDWVVLSAGDMIPADCRITAAKDLFVSQAAMTGESMPVEKFAEEQSEQGSNPLALHNLVFMGTNVVSGSATAIVITTGKNTYFGELARRVITAERPMTAFQSGINKVSWILIRFMMVMVPLVFFINGMTKGNWIEASLFALSIAVGLTPELLPMIVTSTLARGAVFLSHKKVIVKRLDAIQNFGAMDLLCTDKTGTLTQDKIFLDHHVDVSGQESDEVLKLAYLNSAYQTGLKNLLDVAVLDHAKSHGALESLALYHKIDEIPFDFVRRRMSVIVEDSNKQHHFITKGAIEELLSACVKVHQDGQEVPMSPEKLAYIRKITAALNEEGLRVVGVASKIVTSSKTSYSIKDESELTLMGYLAFLDPAKESTAPALKVLTDHGVSIKVLTGDNELVTAKICHEVGLSADAWLLGSDIEGMSDADLAVKIEQITIFAKLSPAHKERIVRQFKANGHVVGFVGDGINDAPALHAADIGISVDSGVDIAKEAADIILLEKSLMVLGEGMLEGRRTFCNMLKYIKMTVSSNFGNVLSVLVASAFIPFLPMLPIHLLVQNLLYDFSQIPLPFDNVDEEMIQRPQRWVPADISRFMVYFGPISSLFDLTTFAVMWFVFKATTPADQTLFQSGWFVVGVLTQTLIVHMIRSPKIPFFQSRASNSLMLTTGLIVGIAIFLPMGPYADYIKLQPLPLLYFACLPIILFGYMICTQFMKNYYKRHFGWQ